MNLYVWRKKPKEESPLQKRKKAILKAIGKVDSKIRQSRGFWIGRHHTFSREQLRRDVDLEKAFEEIEGMLNEMKERLEEGDLPEYHQLRSTIVEMELKMLHLIEKIDEREPTFREKWANWWEE